MAKIQDRQLFNPDGTTEEVRVFPPNESSKVTVLDNTIPPRGCKRLGIGSVGDCARKGGPLDSTICWEFCRLGRERKGS